MKMLMIIANCVGGPWTSSWGVTKGKGNNGDNDDDDNNDDIIMVMMIVV